jgi:hypothetical protein
MQPKPELEGRDVIGLDHLEVINPDTDTIFITMKETNADCYTDETNKYKNIVVSYINDRRERVKFTNKKLSEIVPLQIQNEPDLMEICKITT